MLGYEFRIDKKNMKRTFANFFIFDQGNLYQCNQHTDSRPCIPISDMFEKVAPTPAVSKSIYVYVVFKVS